MDDAVTVRPALPEDAPPIARVHWESWLATYCDVFPQQVFDEFGLVARERHWRREAELDGDALRRSRLLVAMRRGEVAGFAHVGPYRVQTADDPAAAADGELRALYLDPGLQRQGIGTTLWHAATDALRQAGFGAMRLWCIACNPAESFYLAMGAQLLRNATFDAHGTTLRENCYRLRPLQVT